jgi:uncharacterized protein (TIGR02452 family)
MLNLNERQEKTIKEIKSDWVNKNDLRQKAVEHHRLMGDTHMLEIKNSVQKSIIYGGNGLKAVSFKEIGIPVQTVINKDAVSALNDYVTRYRNVCLLNFASYKHPGGGFMMGSRAQEEALCHESILYEVLSSPELSDYYKWNNEHKNRALYLDRAVYSPEVLFEKDGKVFRANVLTCAAPNIATAERYQMAGSDENLQVIKERMQFIANILEENHIDCFIGGAWGCGVFGQLPEEIAELYKTTAFGKTLKEIVHPIIGKNNNYEVFEKILKQKV